MIYFSEFFYLLRIIIGFFTLLWIVFFVVDKGYIKGFRHVNFDTTFFSLLFSVFSLVLTMIHGAASLFLKYINALYEIPETPTPWYLIKPVSTWNDQAQSLIFIVDILWIFSLCLKSLAVWLPIALWHFSSRVKAPVKIAMNGSTEKTTYDSYQIKYPSFKNSIEVVLMVLSGIVSACAPVGLAFIFRSDPIKASSFATLPYIVSSVLQILFCISTFYHLRKAVHVNRKLQESYASVPKVKVAQALNELVGNISFQYLHLTFILSLEVLCLALISVDGILYPKTSVLNMFSVKRTLDTVAFVFLVASSLTYPMSLRTLFQD